MERTKAAAKYDPGTHLLDDGWLCLHRNENLYAGREWTVATAAGLLEAAAIAKFPDAGSVRVREALGELYGVGPENVFVGNGSDEVLSDLFQLLRPSYAEVALLDVCFRIYLLLAERFGYEVTRMPGRAFETGRIEPNGWRGLAVLDSPNAITSVRFDPGTILSLADAPDSFVVWDNVYGEYAGDAVPRSMPANAVVVRSFSKFYALAGLRIGYCIADRALVDELLARKDAFNVNSLAQVLAVEALRRRGEFEEQAGRMLECRRRLVRELRALGFSVHEPAGNFVLARHPGIGGERLQADLGRHRIAVRRFPAPPTADHVRITVPLEADLPRLMGALDEIVAGAGAGVGAARLEVR